MKEDYAFLRICFQLAKSALEEGLEPFTALLVKDGQQMASSRDQSIPYSDPTAHAELVLISEYCREKQLISLEGYTLYSFAEPCVMCSGAIHWSRISRAVFGISQGALQQVSGGKPKPTSDAMINIGRKKVEVIGPLLEEEGLEVLRSFPFTSKKEKWKRYWEKK